MNLIYFDKEQFVENIFVEEYRKAYFSIISTLYYDRDYIPSVYIWTGRKNSDTEIIVYDLTDGHLDVLSKNKINKIWIRGNNFDWDLFSDTSAEIVNSKEVHEFCKDKLAQHNVFTDLMPELLQETGSGRKLFYNFVVKPIYGSKGKDIKTIRDMWSYVDVDTTKYLYEEFLHPKEFPELNIGKEIHDIRLISFFGEIVGISIRRPREGSLISNVHNGGSIQVIDVKSDYLNVVPTSLFDFHREIISRKQELKDSIVSIDLVSSTKGLKLFELNSFPGLRLEYKTFCLKLKEWLRHQ